MNESNNNMDGAARKAWAKPELTRIEAGSAENGQVNRRDGSFDPGTAQS